jgi:Domain of unknown function (DUF4412)
MKKIKEVTFNSVNLFLMLLLASALLIGCGKKETSSSDGKEDKTDTNDDNKSGNFSKDKPFMVEFELTGREKGNGTVSAIYSGNKCRSTSSFDMDGKKMSATAYFDGGDVVYTVTEVAGMKMGVKFDKKKFSDTKDNVDVNSFRDYLDQMEKTGEEEIIGYKCEIFKHKEKNITVSLYEKTVPLRMGSADGKTYMKATKFEKDVKVTDDMFKAPQDVKYTDMSSMMDEMKKLGADKNFDKKMENLKDKTKEMEDVMKNYKK